MQWPRRAAATDGAMGQNRWPKTIIAAHSHFITWLRNSLKWGAETTGSLASLAIFATGSPLPNALHKATVVGDDRVGAALAARHMTAERGCAAVLDGRHHLHLVETDVTDVGAPPRRPVVAEDIRNLQ